MHSSSKLSWKLGKISYIDVRRPPLLENLTDRPREYIKIQIDSDYNFLSIYYLKSETAKKVRQISGENSA